MKNATEVRTKKRNKKIHISPHAMKSKFLTICKMSRFQMPNQSESNNRHSIGTRGEAIQSVSVSVTQLLIWKGANTCNRP